MPIIIIVGFVTYYVLAPDKPIEQRPTPVMEKQPAISKDTIKQDSIVEKDTIKTKPQEPVRVQSPRAEKKKDSVKVEEPKEEIYNPIY